MANPLQVISVITVIRNTENKYLLVQRAANDDIFPLKWQNMGGKVELGETLENAIIREVKEEIGIDIDKNIKPIFLQSYSWKKDEKSDVKLGVIFLIEMNQENLDVTISDELNDYGWFNLEEIEKLDTIAPKSPTGTLGQLGEALKI